MSGVREERSTAALPQPGLVRRFRVHAGVSLVLLLLIWVGLSVLPESSGVAFGLIYQVFFSAVVLVGLAFFWLLEQDRVASPKSTLGVMGVVMLVSLGTVGALVAVGSVLPQFEGRLAESEGPGAVVQDAAGRGEVLFRNGTADAPACVQCHTAEGIRGGTRGPSLAQVASRAGGQVPGLAAEQYLLEKVKAGMTYEFKVEGYVPIMPPFGVILSEDQISDLVVFLLTMD